MVEILHQSFGCPIVYISLYANELRSLLWFASAFIALHVLALAFKHALKTELFRRWYDNAH